MANVSSDKIAKKRTEEGKTVTGHFWHSTENCSADWVNLHQFVL